MMKQVGVETKINCLYVILAELHVSGSIEAAIKTPWKSVEKNCSHVLHRPVFVKRSTLPADTLNNCYQQT